MENNNQWVDDRLAKLNPEDDWQPQVPVALAKLEGKRGRTFPGRWPRALLVAAAAAICIVMFPQPRALAQRVVTPCLEACQSFVLEPGNIHAHLYRFFVMVHQMLGIAPPPEEASDRFIVNRLLGIAPPSIIAESHRQMAPDFEVTDANGATFHLSDYEGKVVLLNFWASWCDPCKREMPWFAEFQKTRASQGFAVIGVSLDEEGWKAVRPAMEALKVNYRVALGDEALAKRYGGIESLPQTLVIDREGRIAATHSGIVSKGFYEAEIDYLLGKNRGTT